jgi:pre-rRNA-processing protein TSR4
MASEIDIQKHISLLDSSDDESDNEYDGQEDIELGFVNQVARVSDANELHLNSDWSKWDGGKVGGKPSWLNPKKIPAGEKLNCLECAHPMSFLLQIYCPLDEIPDAFHRSLYVFCCRNAVCSQIGSAKILRCQLPQLNNIYSAESGVEGQIQADTSLCALCGQRATFTCSACHVAQYCSKTHQKDHWSNGHKEDCIQWYISSIISFYIF